MKKIRILSTINMEMLGKNLDKLKKKSNFSFEEQYNKNLKKKLKDADIYISSAKIKVDKNFLTNAKKLKFIYSPSTGTDHIDLKELEKKNIKLIHIAKERKLLNSFTATSELVFALILMLTRSLIKNYSQIKKNIWARDKYFGEQLHNKTLGVIGLGRLGNITSKIGNGFGMNVIGYDIKKNIKVRKVKNVSLSFLLKKSDIISIHIHLNDKNKNFIDKKKLQLTKLNSILINTSRGQIINEKDLLFFLKTRKHFRAGLDVIDGEWLNKNTLKKHPLINYSKKNHNLIILPHIGGSTIESIYGARLHVIKKILNKLN